ATLKSRRCSVSQLASELGVSSSSIYLWWKGVCVPDADTFHTLCAVLDVPPDFLAPETLASIRKSEKNPLTLWLRDLGLWGKSAHGKFVPDIIFRLTR